MNGSSLWHATVQLTRARLKHGLPLEASKKDTLHHLLAFETRVYLPQLCITMAIYHRGFAFS